MKIEFELPEKYKDKKLVLCLKDEPVPIAYLNIFKERDVWIKIKGCEGCPEENKKKCCNRCPILTEKGCLFQLGDNSHSSNKPYSCVVLPSPERTLSYCKLEFECISGPNKGIIKKIGEPLFLDS